MNAFKVLGHSLKVVSCPDDIKKAERLVFPGVGAFGACMTALNEKGFTQPLKEYLSSGKPFLGICIGLQALFEGSQESPNVQGLGVIKGNITKFDNTQVSVPQIGWNGILTNPQFSSPVLPHNSSLSESLFYFVHSFHAPVLSFTNGNSDNNSGTKSSMLATTNYGNQTFVSAVQLNNPFQIATQFHPEKSGKAGLQFLDRFVKYCEAGTLPPLTPGVQPSNKTTTTLSKRIVACLDVRSNDQGDLVVTKGDQYDVRDAQAPEGSAKGVVRNLGKPKELAQRYYNEGADEITFLNITSFRNCPLSDLPMIQLLRTVSETVYVPLTVGGGIRDFVDPETGKHHSSLDVASEYFRSGADKVSIGSDAVDAAIEYINSGQVRKGTSSIEQINYVYGAQAVVVSVDPIRVYVKHPSDTTHHTIKHRVPGPDGSEYCWYQCTVKGGRETKDLDVKQLITAVQELGAGEVLLNCINQDGTNQGFDLDLIKDVKAYANIPVIASSGAGKAMHFVDLFKECPEVEAGLAAGIFHRKEVQIEEVKQAVHQNLPNVVMRITQ